MSICLVLRRNNSPKSCTARVCFSDKVSTFFNFPSFNVLDRGIADAASGVMSLLR